LKPETSVITIFSKEEKTENKPPDIFNKNGHIRFIYSFQFQLIKAALLSLLFTLLTLGTLALFLFLIFSASGKASSFTEFFQNRQDNSAQQHLADSEDSSLLQNNQDSSSQQFGAASDNEPLLQNNQNSSSQQFEADSDDEPLLQNSTDKRTPLENRFPPAKKLIRNRQRRAFFLFFGILSMFSVALFLCYFLLLTRRFSNYLAEITLGINKIAEGDLEHQIRIRAKDELSLIAGCINEMSAQIQENMERERQAEQEKNQMITSVAHDIRTPLTSILGYLELLFHKNPEQALSCEQYQNYIRIAYEKSRRLMALTEDLFTYTKVSFGEMKIQKKPLDLILFLEQMIEEFYPSLMDAGLCCHFSHSEASLRLNGDSSMLSRAFSNLFSNAVKYGKDGKLLLVSAEAAGENAVIKITNYGMIIPEESLRHIFERFYRVENSRSLDTGGSGLGLSIARKIILLHEGTIQAKSGHDGTVFTISLPLHDNETDTKTDNKNEERTRNG
jgi:signal transduction histidine kinase